VKKTHSTKAIAKKSKSKSKSKKRRHLIASKHGKRSQTKSHRSVSARE
jgi:hypothetical protein